MQQLVSTLFEQTRRARGLRVSQLAAPSGYRNVAKFCRRWEAFQRRDEARYEFVMAVAVALGLDRQQLMALIEEQRRQFVDEWNTERDKPFKPSIRVLAFMALYHQEDLPPRITYQQAEQYAHRLALVFRKFVVLNWSSRFSVRFDGTGRLVRRTFASPEASMPQYMQQHHKTRVA